MVKAPVFQLGDETERVVQTAEFIPRVNDTITNSKGGDFIVWLPTNFDSHKPRYSSHN